MKCPAMAWSGFFWLLGILVLAGCIPAGQSQFDEEKEPHYLAGKSRVNAMDFKGAVEAFQKALEVNPHSAAAHFELGWLCDQKEADPAAAIYHYDRYLKLRANADNAEMVRTRILACKQELARTVSLGPVTQAMEKEFQQLAEENKRLKAELEQWKVYAASLQALTNRSAMPVEAGATGGAAGDRGPGARLANSRQAGGTSAGTGGTAVAKAPATRTHSVKSGETPSSIARIYGVKLDALLAANPGVNPKRIRVGQVLKIPASP